MKLTVREAARLLAVPEGDLYRWIDAGEIPCYLVNHQPLFSRAELLEWAMARHLPLSPELFEEGSRTIHLADALAAGGVHVDVAAADRDQVLRAVVERLPIATDDDREMVLEILRAREQHMSTAVGRGIAVPHVRAPLVLAGCPAAVSLCFLARPVDFGDQPVHTVFAMMTPTIRGHLQLLSRLSYALHDDGFRAAVATREAAPILEAARRIDRLLASSSTRDGAEDDEGGE